MDLSSTVSKVLRQKEKYLQKQTDAVRSPERRVKGRPPDIEKTLSNWVMKQQKKGVVLSDDLIREKAQYFASVSGPEHAASTPANNPVWLSNFKRKHNITNRKASKDNSTSSKKASSIQSPEDDMSLSPQDESSPSPRALRDVRSDESLKTESPDGFCDLNTTMSANSAVYTSTSTSPFCSDTLLSPTSPFFTPDSANVPMSSFFRNNESCTFPSSPTIGDFQRPRSQTFPMLFSDLHPDNSNNNPNSSSDDYRFSPSNDVLDVPMDDLTRPLSSIDEAMADSPPADTDDLRRTSSFPTQTSPMRSMQPPALPASASATALPLAFRKDSHAGFVYESSSDTKSGSGSGSGWSGSGSQGPSAALERDGAGGGSRSPPAPSQDEARRALQVVWQYFSSQPRSGSDEMLDMEETAMMGKLKERLRDRGRER